MFALLAFICFLLALFRVRLGSIDLVVLGLAFIALHLLVGSVITMPFKRNASEKT